MTNSSEIILFFVWMFISLTFCSHQGGRIKECAGYCDIYGNLENPFKCPDEFCCGNETKRYCCSNSTLDMSHIWGETPDNCSLIHWRSYYWQFLLITMVTLILMVIFSACCCHCCSQKTSWEDTRVPRERRTRSNTVVSSIEMEQSTPQPTFFDPRHPYAFVPPDYESLPKDPPAYNEIFGVAGTLIESLHSGDNAIDVQNLQQHSDNPDQQNQNTTENSVPQDRNHQNIQRVGHIQECEQPPSYRELNDSIGRLGTENEHSQAVSNRNSFHEVNVTLENETQRQYDNSVGEAVDQQTTGSDLNSVSVNTENSTYNQTFTESVLPPSYTNNHEGGTVGIASTTDLTS